MIIAGALFFEGYWYISDEFRFRDVVFQSGICSSGSLNGILVGSHYNWAWAIHSSKRILWQLNLAIVTDKYLRFLFIANIIQENNV